MLLNKFIFWLGMVILFSACSLVTEIVRICIAVPIEVLVPQKLIRNCPFSNIFHISRAIFTDH